LPKSILTGWRIGSFEFNLRELAGSLGDFGTLFPLAVGYMAVCRMNPAGLLVMMGLANIVTGLIYRLPIPIEPMKVIAIVAIAQAWNPEKIAAAGLGMGILWLLLGATPIMAFVARWTPKTVVRGIQLSLGVLLAIEGLKLIGVGWGLGVLSLVIVVIFRKSRYAPASILLVVLGLALVVWRGQWPAPAAPTLTWPPFTPVALGAIWPALRDAGFAQIPLTATNAVIATAALLVKYWPDRRVTERQLSLDHGVMNLISCFFGGMPMCHGAGGLAGQYYFGARTGGANLIEGTIEVVVGLFFAGSIAAVFAAFPLPIIGAMLFLVGIELTKFARELKPGREWIPMIATLIGALVFNMAAGFVVGMIVHYGVFRKNKTAT